MQRKFADLPLGTRFRYLPIFGIDQVFVVLENWGVGLIAKWDGPEHGPINQVLAFADSEIDAQTWVVDIAEASAQKSESK